MIKKDFPSNPKKSVVVIGGGFGGLNAAKTLANREDFSVILVDQKNHHLFQPLLYQVATAGLSPSDIAVPIRAQFSKAENVEVHLARVKSVDLTLRRVHLESTELDYDYLILACGAQHSYFAHPEWEEFAPGLKTLEQATEIRRRILSAFENAENETSEEAQQAFLTFVIVGGGPTGVELAGAIADISRTVLVKDFKRINPLQARVILLEAGSRVLASFDEKLSRKTAEDLRILGVDVRTSSRVEKIDANGVQVGAELIASRCVFWGAGVQAAPLIIEPVPEKDRAGRLKVRRDLSLTGYPNVFAVGDMASIEDTPGKLVPGLAPAAIQAGRHAANVILQSVVNERRPEFHYVDKGQMATIGKHRAVLQSGPVRLTGYIAWLAWLFVHIFYLIGFKNRLAVFLQWAWSYAFSQRGSRLITETQWKLRK